jgi:hypothetical protein
MGFLMDEQFKSWQRAVERFLQDAAPDYRDVARLVGEIAASGETLLQQAATQALPSLRNAAVDPDDRITVNAARRRLGVVLEALHSITTPRFGRRGIAPKSLTPEEHYRQMLGLPFGRRLAKVEIHQAYKRSAKMAHPDMGGSAQAFCELAAARDALIRSGGV